MIGKMSVLASRLRQESAPGDSRRTGTSHRPRYNDTGLTYVAQPRAKAENRSGRFPGLCKAFKNSQINTSRRVVNNVSDKILSLCRKPTGSKQYNRTAHFAAPLPGTSSLVIRHMSQAESTASS